MHAEHHSTDEQRIRELIETWAAAVRAGDLRTVVADHADDIVMFDVPPPHDGLRGIDAYRESWPPFFEWQAQGASFEIISLEVVVGADVAFAYALLHCGTPDDLAARPDQRLRLTLGLAKVDGRWIVRHEHHSFAHPGDQEHDEAASAVREVHQQWSDRTAAGDLDGIMAAIDEDVVSYEHVAPLEYRGSAAVREVCRRGLDAAADGDVRLGVEDLTVIARDDLAVTWGLNRVSVREPGGEWAEHWSRGTRIFRRRGGAWLMVHQHLSVPVEE